MDNYVSQTDGIIAAIRKNPGISRSELVDLRVEWFRIANVTARISNARAKLEKTGETILCGEEEPLKVGKKRVRMTNYTIIPF